MAMSDETPICESKVEHEQLSFPFRAEMTDISKVPKRLCQKQRFTEDDQEHQRKKQSPTNAYAALKQARVESNGKMEFMRKSSYIVHESAFCLVGGMLLLLCLPVVNIAMGGLYIHSCPAERLIPIFLIVAGCFAIIFYIPDIITRINKVTGKEEEDDRVRTAGCGLVGFFLIIWFLIGSYWVYNTYDAWTAYPETAQNYCHPVLYYYAFSMVSLIYVCLFFSFCMSFCLCCMAI